MTKTRTEPLKIAISGSISTGKTTLGKALAESLSLPIIEEQLENVFVMPKGARRDMRLRFERIMELLKQKESWKRKVLGL
jgi:cytidylate kinase